MSSRTVRFSPSGQVADQLVAALVALDGVDGRDGRQGRVQRVVGEVDAEHPGQLPQGVVRGDQVRELLLQGAGLGLGRRDERDDAGQDGQVLRAPAVPGEPPLEVRVERLPLGERVLRGEHGLGVLRGERLARLGRAGLDQQRAALRGAAGRSAGRPRGSARPRGRRGAPWSASAKTPLAWSSRSASSSQQSQSASATSRNSVARPYRSAWARTLSRPKLRGLRVGPGGDDVPAGAAAADVVERGERAGQRGTARCSWWTRWR